jgi:hypothetical protein
MKNLSLLLISAIAILLLASCNKSQDKTLFTTVMKTDKGDIRGVNLNSSPDQVKQIEGITPDSTAEGYLFYIIDYPSKHAKIKIEYNFDDNGLYSAYISIKAEGDSVQSFATIDTLQSKIKKLLTKKYGLPTSLSPENFLWSFKSNSGSPASAQMINNSKIEGTGSLELIVQTEVE